MSDPIKVGDLVQVVRGCGCHDGVVFTAGETFRGVGAWRCGYCPFTIFDATIVWNADAVQGRTCNVPLAWLKRIQPPEELDDVKRDEEITA